MLKKISLCDGELNMIPIVIWHFILRLYDMTSESNYVQNTLQGLINNLNVVANVSLCFSLEITSRQEFNKEIISLEIASHMSAHLFIAIFSLN